MTLNPLRLAWGFWAWLRARQDGFKVVLVGEGSDELFFYRDAPDAALTLWDPSSRETIRRLPVGPGVASG